MPKRPLLDATTDELCEELCRRHSAAVIGLLSRRDDDEVFSYHFQGGAYTCIGMAEQLSHKLLNRNNDVRPKRKR